MMGVLTMQNRITLGEIGVFRNGVNFTKEQMGRGLKLINVKDIFGDSPLIDFNKLDLVDLGNKDIKLDYTVDKNDLFFVRSSVKRDGVGLVRLASMRNRDAIHCGFIIRFRLTRKDVDALFLTYSLRTPEARNKIINISGGSAIINISQSSLASLQLTLPSYLTQRKIAAILSAYDDLIEINLQRIKILEEMAQNLYREWFVNFRFPGHKLARFVNSPMGRIPEGWVVVKVGDVLKKMKRLPKVPRGNYVLRGLFPVIDQGKDFIGGYTDDEDTIISDDLPVIIFGDHTRVLKYIDFPFARGADGTQTLKSSNERLPMSLFYYVLSEIDLSSYAYARHFKFLKDELILLPDKKSALLFEEFIEPNLNHKKTLSKANINLRQTRDLLLPKLISDEVDVSEIDINVPEEGAV